jgi:hypothetical protein
MRRWRQISTLWPDRFRFRTNANAKVDHAANPA